LFCQRAGWLAVKIASRLTRTNREITGRAFLSRAVLERSRQLKARCRLRATLIENARGCSSSRAREGVRWGAEIPPLRFSAKSTHQINYQADEQNQSDATATVHRSAQVKAAAAKEE